MLHRKGRRVQAGGKRFRTTQYLGQFSKVGQVLQRLWSAVGQEILQHSANRCNHPTLTRKIKLFFQYNGELCFHWV